MSTFDGQCEWRQSPVWHISEVESELVALASRGDWPGARWGQVGSEQGHRVMAPTGRGIHGAPLGHAVQQWWGHLDQTPSSRWLCCCQHWEGAGCLAVSTGHFGMEGELLPPSGMLQQLYCCFSLLASLSGTQASTYGNGALLPDTPAMGWDPAVPWAPHCRTCIQQGSSLAHSAPCAGQQRRDLMPQDFHQTALIWGIMGTLASFWLQ